MNELASLMADYEAELRKIADEHGGEVEVWRFETAEVLPFQPQAEMQARPASQDDEQHVKNVAASKSDQTEGPVDDEDFDSLLDEIDFGEFVDDSVTH